MKFLIRRDDVARFLETAEKEEASEGMQWTVFLTVAENKAFFRAGPTTSNCPIHGASVGRVKMPLSSLAEAIGWGWYRPKTKKDEIGKTEWAEMTFIDGRVSYGKRSSRNDGISLACSVQAYEFYPTQPEIILLSRLLDPETASRIGLDTRLAGIQDNLEFATSKAFLALERYGVTFEDVKDTIEKVLKRTEPEVVGSSFYQWCNRKGD